MDGRTPLALYDHAMLTMGSLFDGIGGFPLAAVRNGITPVWASEIEPFPIRVTKEHFPGMIHVGDITRLDGAKLPPVDVVCGGSPCQDLSVAGTRNGLAGARSGLFMEQVRIVKEMRAADVRRGRTGVSIRPRFLCWENVPGAFSSGTPKGEDFRIVLEEICKISGYPVYVPRPHPWPWQPAGRIMNPAVLLLVVALLGGGGALYYFKFMKNKPKTKGPDNLDDYDYGDEEDELWESEEGAEEEPEESEEEPE